MSNKTILVIGSTGQQGRGVVKALLSQTPFLVRAVTTDTSSTRAHALLDDNSSAVEEGRFELVQANLDDVGSLEVALKGCQGCFAAFNPTSVKEGEMPREIVQGKNLVDAAKKVGLEHFVYSTLNSIKEETQGELSTIHHHESKAAVAKYAKENLKSVTLLVLSAFLTNLNTPAWTRRQKEDDTALFCAPFGPDVGLAWVDPTYDCGNFAAAIFKKGPETMKDKQYFVASQPTSIPKIAQRYHEITGERVHVHPLSIREGAHGTAEALGIPEIGDELEAVFEYFNKRYAGIPENALDGMINQGYEDLGVKASTFSEFVERTGWRVK